MCKMTVKIIHKCIHEGCTVLLRYRNRRCKKHSDLHWRLNNKAKKAEKDKEYRIKNREKIAARKKERYNANIEKMRERSRIYASNHKEAARARYLKWKANNPGKKSEYNKLWYSKNKERARATRKAWLAKDPVNAISARFRSMIRTRLVRLNTKNLPATGGGFKNVPFTAQELAQHLENLFTEGMSWQNMNLWSIDHKIPLKFKNPDGTYYWNQEDLVNPSSETFQKAWSLENLQPMWRKDNCSKQARYSEAA